MNNSSHPNTTPAPDAAGVITGVVIDQSVTVTARDEPAVVLTVQLADPPRECEVRLSLPADNDNTLRITLDHLKRLGFEDDDVTRLHSDHPDPVLFTGKQVQVRCKTVNGVDYWNLAWPRQKATLEKLQETAVSLRTRIAAVRAAKAKPKGTTPGGAA